MDNDKAVVGREHLWSITSAFEPGDHHPRLQIADLGGGDFARLPAARPRLRLGSAHAKQGHRDNGSPDVLSDFHDPAPRTGTRSEERRVGKGGVRTCKFRWGP